MPDLKAILESIAAGCGMKGLLEYVTEVPVASAETYLASADEALGGRPFADLGPRVNAPRLPPHASAVC